ncbi:MAG: T9SS type A sorting domain-containing protein [Saprospiraceae bacterium]|nr:T9SS type A sorting domain-containing protein [Saprospiraceae bacterium]
MGKHIYKIIPVLFFWLINTNIFSQTCAGSPPTVLSFDVTGYMAAGAFGNSGNTMNLICGLPPGGNIVGLQWSNYTYNTIGDTWCNEVFLDIDTNVYIYMISGGSFPGPCGPHAGGSPLALQNAGINFSANPSGCVAVQPFLSYTTAPVGAQITGGIITLTACPLGVPLPIQISRFEVSKKGPDNVVEWETLSEVNNETQIVERSANGIEDWNEIGRLRGAGTTQEQNIYRMVDHHPLALGYYRLKSVDYDGHFEYSTIVDVLRKDLFGDKINGVQIYADNLSLEFITNNEDGVQITISDVTGKIVMSGQYATKEGLNYYDIDLYGAGAGMYYITVINHRYKETKSFVR